MKSKHPIYITVLLLMVIPASQVAVDMYLPSLPAMAAHWHVTSTSMQLSFTFYLLTMGVSQLFYGPLSDRFGRRPILLTGLLINLAGSIVCALSITPDMLYVGRLLQGLGAGSIFVISNAAFSDVFSGSALARRVTWGSLVWSLVPILAPAIGGLVQEHLGWQANFYIMAGYTLLMFVLLFFGLPETLSKEATVESIGHLVHGYIKIATNVRFLSFITCVVFSYGAVIVFNIAGPFILQNKLGLNAEDYGMYVLIVGLTYGVSTFINGSLLKYFKVKYLLLIGVIVTLLSGVTLIVFDSLGMFNVMTVIVATCVLQVGQGFVFANCLAGSLNNFTGLAGSVSSLFGSVVIVGVMVISAVAAHFNVQTQSSLAISYLALGVLTILGALPALLTARQARGA